jgi:hypothetical protein
MAVEYPYVNAQSALTKAFAQFRKSFPATMDAATLQKFGIAPSNESYVINTFRFLGLIDGDGKKADDAAGFFFGGDAAFNSGLEDAIRAAYESLFADFGEDAWNNDRAEIATWFRVTDKTSDVVGGRQASTFQTLAALAGHGELPLTVVTPAKPTSTRGPSNATKSSKGTQGKSPATGAESQKSSGGTGGGKNQLDMTVRIEINVPAGATPAEYDAMFASIRKHLIDRG